MWQSHRQERYHNQVIGQCLRLFVGVYKLVNVVLTFVYHTKSHSQERYHNQVIGIIISLQVLLPEAICWCLQTCKC